MVRITKHKKGTIPMGMAASQARFLGLTARLNNVEFEAQQIHQQRTALSNKSAGYYTDLLGLAVPTAPSVDQFTKTTYTFDDGALTNQITAMIATGDGTYKVSYLKTYDDEFSIVSAAPRIITHTTMQDPADPAAILDLYHIGPEVLRKLDQWNLGDGSNFIEFAQGNVGGVAVDTVLQGGQFGYINAANQFVAYTDADAYTPEIINREGIFASNAYYKGLSLDQIVDLSSMEAKYAALINENVGAGSAYTRYVLNTTTNEFKPTFYMENDLNNAEYTDDGNSISYINAYQVGKKTINQEIIGVEGCLFEQDSTGRYMSITIPDANGGSRTYALSTNTITDQIAYEDAMNQYEYDKAVYDHSMAEINSKIEIVQSEDKNLELRLKQLDTEHNAIQTERDQVKELIKKNVDSSFKTFG